MCGSNAAPEWQTRLMLTQQIPLGGLSTRRAGLRVTGVPGPTRIHICSATIVMTGGGTGQGDGYLVHTMGHEVKPWPERPRRVHVPLRHAEEDAFFKERSKNLHE
jgi:hypothetical protein